ncbi:hypothetical protein MM26B8_01360 [Mycoplasmopsis meleagridis]|uniref:TNase-like domain-containing protein n=2 Tax=Mycoplasmopsis meleagridis TaxID=29561 RepID=A0A0F5H255_9BACT|nr:hypothetical protein [Mycoplasmopsis meleagridis]KKB26922.1 hypothetical protein MMELEA_03720 [Mycoplasmopsis meleagridis ATCC 25294]KUH47463.1 hypothetical protein ASB56_01185 [Mycoplasmopsis meleagridis]OAD18511.1 hypothetical protein MM26B8_01360 [Mycoplasmopsis meleagridis]
MKKFKKLFIPLASLTLSTFGTILAVSCQNEETKEESIKLTPEDKERQYIINSRLNDNNFFIDKVIPALGIGSKINKEVTIPYSNGTININYKLEWNNSSKEEIKATNKETANEKVKLASYTKQTDTYKVFSQDLKSQNSQMEELRGIRYTYKQTIVDDKYLDLYDFNTSLTSSELEEIQNLLNQSQIQLKIKDQEADNVYYVPSYKILNPYYVVDLSSGKKILLEYNNNILNPKVTDTEKTTEANKDFTTKRVVTYKVFVLNTTTNQWEGALNKTVSREYNVTINFALPSSLNTRFDKAIAKKIDVNWDELVNSSALAEITRWADGDTVYFKVIQDFPLDSPLYNEFHDAFINQTEFKLRIRGIDTPEKHVGTLTSSPFEYQYAELSSAFGETNFPAGTKIKVVFNGNAEKDAFGRYLGDFFFGNNFEYSYTVEIVNAGLTLPLYSEDDVKNAINQKRDSFHYSTIQLADAFNEAMINKRGFYKNFVDGDGVNSSIYIMKPSSVYAFLSKNREGNIYETGYYDRFLNLEKSSDKSTDTNNS